ncbi:PREDICTED: F-box only protein 36 isoform X1 [Myotis brandtii]|uniref:F-box only protein 36 isoform X1 n=1 Tax=Myotis brandtii TaxID=109478 RepID=UPI00070462E6|nr:PREDICTED: F-box only protein 36 isoform X1 [Myotis brandtii]
MASWLPEILFEIVGQGKAPSKDHYQMLITRSQVIFRWWKISLRSGYQSTKPGEVKESHEDFRENSHLQSPFSSLLSQPWTCSFSCLATISDSAPLISHSRSSAWILGVSADLGTVFQIALVFGARILDYVFNLCEGKIDFLERLSDNLLMNIISYLGIEDIASLSLTSHRFSKLCTSDELWEPIIEASSEITPAMKALAQDQGWRQKFFIRKLHLRKKQNQKSQAGSQ